MGSPTFQREVNSSYLSTNPDTLQLFPVVIKSMETGKGACSRGLPSPQAVGPSLPYRPDPLAQGVLGCGEQQEVAVSVSPSPCDGKGR